MRDRILIEVESYLNGNIQQFKDFLKKCSKDDLIYTIGELRQKGKDDLALVLRLLER